MTAKACVRLSGPYTAGVPLLFVMMCACLLSGRNLVSGTFGSKGKMNMDYYGGGGSGIELCQCPNIPAPTKYVAVEVPKPVRVTTIPAPNSGNNMIPVVLPDRDGSDGGYGGGSDGYD